MWHRTSAIPLVAAVLVAPPAAFAQGWDGTLAISFVERSLSGSEASFRSQANLDDGVSLDELDLRYRGAEGKRNEFTLEMSGFGGAEPSQSLDLDWRFHRPWRLELDYDRRESFFELAEHEQGLRTDDWDVERWHAGVVWDGWKAARLRLDLRTTDRSGHVERPIFELNERYPLRVDLDETARETAFTLETRTLPFTLRFEQSLAVYERDNRRSPAGAENLEGDDFDFFAVADERRREDRDVPTTRVAATYGNSRWEVAGSLLYSPAELDGVGPVSAGFDIVGGLAGRVELIDDLVASAEMDSLVGNLRIGVRLAAGWTLRFEGDYRDTSTDATLLGERLIRITNPFGNVFDLAGSVDESTVFDVTDDDARLTLEWSGGGFTVWAGGFNASRDVRWTLPEDDLDATRDSDGFLVGASWSKGGVKGSAEYEHGSFDRLVFRTDPETVDRLTLKLRAELAGRWQVRLHGRFADAENPPPEVAIPEADFAALDRSSESYGAGLDWTSEDGDGAFGLALDRFDFTSEIDLVLPGGAPGVSLYDLSLLTATVHGRTELGKLRIDGSAVRLDDSGGTWPVESWIARARLGYPVRDDLEITAFGEYWSYDEDRGERDDYDVTRYGLGFRWSFQ